MGLTRPKSDVIILGKSCVGDNSNDCDNCDESMPSKQAKPSIVDWIFSCYNASTGGFGGNTGHDGHLLYTLSALQLLAMADSLQDPRLDQDAVSNFISGLQQPDGSFSGDSWGEIDTRFSYCALSSLKILGAISGEGKENYGDNSTIDTPKAAEYVASCQNFDGGFGCIKGAESHAGQVFCCVAALSLAQSLHLIRDRDLLCWWLAERQCDSGGLNGRPEKQADVCYSWWILSALSILGCQHWIDSKALVRFVLRCQDDEDGGIADHPDNMADAYHTFFGIAGLSLLGYLHNLEENDVRSSIIQSKKAYRMIDPIYALPTDVVKKLHLGGQVAMVGESVDERLAHYDIFKASVK